MTVILFLGSLLAAMALGVPIAYSLLLSGVALMWQLDLFDAQILAQNVIEGANSFPLLAVPFFMLAGEIMNACGLSRRIDRDFGQGCLAGRTVQANDRGDRDRADDPACPMNAAQHFSTSANVML